MKKQMEYVRAEVKSIDGENPNGEFEVILSAPTLDRDGEVIDGKAFEPLPDHITFDIDHGLSTATTVGSGQPYYDGDLLKVKGTFSSIPRAQEVRTLVNEGHIRTTSVAFRDPQRSDEDGVPHITKAELLNGAFVPVPSNRQAAILTAKSIMDAVEDEENETQDQSKSVTEPEAAVAPEKSVSEEDPETADQESAKSPATGIGETARAQIIAAEAEATLALYS